MKDLKNLKDEIKIQLDRETVAEIVSFLGFKIDRSYRFVDDSVPRKLGTSSNGGELVSYAA